MLLNFKFYLVMSFTLAEKFIYIKCNFKLVTLVGRYLVEIFVKIRCSSEYPVYMQLRILII